MGFLARSVLRNCAFVFSAQRQGLSTTSRFLFCRWNGIFFALASLEFSLCWVDPLVGSSHGGERHICSDWRASLVSAMAQRFELRRPLHSHRITTHEVAFWGFWLGEIGFHPNRFLDRALPNIGSNRDFPSYRVRKFCFDSVPKNDADF